MVEKLLGAGADVNTTIAKYGNGALNCKRQPGNEAVVEKCKFRMQSIAAPQSAARAGNEAMTEILVNTWAVSNDWRDWE